MPSLQRHVEALTQASLEIEARSRRPGGSYMRDADAYDGFEEASLKAQQGIVSKGGGKKDAPPHGLAIFTSDDGGFEIHPMGTAKATIGSKPERSKRPEHNAGTEHAPSYEQVNQRSFIEAARRSHEHTRSHGGVEPVDIVKRVPANDAALVRQRLMSAHQRRLTADAYDRNARIAAAMKAESDKLWKKERIA
jgi:hypothetical protein